MNTYAVSSGWIWGTIVFIFLLLGGGGYFIFSLIKKFYTDIVIMIDKNNRWRIFYQKIKGRSSLKMGTKSYMFLPDAGLLNYKGKALYVFSEDKPEPMAIGYKKVSWLDASSLSGVINNKLVQQIIKPVDKFVDMLIILGAIGGILAGLASILILLIQTGVISSVT